MEFSIPNNIVIFLITVKICHIVIEKMDIFLIYIRFYGYFCIIYAKLKELKIKYLTFAL